MTRGRSRRSGMSAGSVQGRGNNSKSAVGHRSYVPVSRVQVRLNVMGIDCTSCGVGVGEKCVVKAGPRIGLPATTYHSERVRMATRLRNEAIARGEEQVKTGPVPRVREQSDRGHGMAVCPTCGHSVPLTPSHTLWRHATNGGQVTQRSVPCRGWVEDTQ